MTEGDDTRNPVDGERLVSHAPDAVIFADRDGVIQTWNAAAERIFGHAPGDAIGQRLDIIIPEQFREAHWTGYHRALAEGETRYVGQSLATKSVDANGETIYVELSFAIVPGDDGAAAGALAHARDITDRFQQEREQRKKLAALEKEVAELKGGGPAEG